MRDGVLSQEWGLQTNFRASPFALGVRRVRRMMTWTSAAELGSKVGALDLVKVLKPAPSLVAHRARYVNF